MLAKATSLVSCSRGGRPTARFLKAMAVIKNLKERKLMRYRAFALNNSVHMTVLLEVNTHPLRIV